MTSVSLSKKIAPPFYEIHRMIKDNLYTYFDLDGGRGSTKSSFVSIEIVNGMMRDRQQGQITHAVCLRMVANTLRTSVVEQIEWAINTLKVGHLWKKTLNPLQFIYKPKSKYPQYIRFYGCDDPTKIKSIKFSYGYPKWLWFEETQEFKKASDLVSVALSIMRKNADDEEEETTSEELPFVIFRTGNPKPELNHWWNIERKYQREDRITHHSDYTMIPQHWLTKAFLDEAEDMKKRNFKEYQNVFLGLVVGSDGLCYPMFDVNKHVVDIDDFKWYYNEKVVQIVCGCDGGTIIDATTLNILCVTTAGRIVRLPAFYYDPVNYNHTPLAPVIQVQLMELWLDYWLWYFKIVYCKDIMIVVDSASQDLMLEFNNSTKYNATSVGKKDVIIDMKRVQNVLTVPDYFITVNAGYIDPLSLPRFKSGNGFENANFNYLGDDDMLIVEMLSLCVNPDTGKPMDGNDHTIDGLKYACKGLNMN